MWQRQKFFLACSVELYGKSRVESRVAPQHFPHRVGNDSIQRLRCAYAREGCASVDGPVNKIIRQLVMGQQAGRN